MIVFGPLGRAYNLKLAPYFLPAPKLREPEPVRKRSAMPAWEWMLATVFLCIAVAAGLSAGSVERNIAAMPVFQIVCAVVGFAAIAALWRYGRVIQVAVLAILIVLTIVSGTLMLWQIL